ncbi:sulfite exporter TauE/SafE family protein [Beggiatoa alba]|nr:sulfite exporter TauE/SafE family protein [Beggiatoa alba]
MPEVPIYLSAFLIGLLGGVHCVGMCGGIMSALTLGVQSDDLRSSSKSTSNMLPYLLSYNMARICSYTIAGFIFGGLGSWISDLVFYNQAQMVLKLLAGLFLIALGLYLANWWRGLRYVEQLGRGVWRFIEPKARRFIPVKTPRQAFNAGLLWGWLPCGLVYSVLIWSLTSGSAIQGGLLMLSFGLGTLPNLIAIGLFASVVKRFMQSSTVSAFAGLAVMGFGVYQIVLVV